MFTAADKALIAAIMAVLSVLENWFGWGGGITEAWVSALIAVITPLLVWLVPNRP